MEISPNKKNKKALIGILVAVFTLLIFVIGATYAYYSLYSSNVENVTDARTTLSGYNSTGMVLFSAITGRLTLDIETNDMIREEDDIVYYASYSGKTTTETEEYIGVASAGLEEDPYSYACEYTLAVTHSGEDDLYSKFSSDNYTNKGPGQLILIIDGNEYDLDDGWPNTVTGTFEVDIENPYFFTAGLKFVNLSDVDQGYLAESDIEIDIDLVPNGLKCGIN